MSTTPPVLPILSGGAHRRPRDGGCFMEIASLLAGDRWSDHPPCTHPVLGAVARCVNDATTDIGRQAITELIPAVIGATSDNPRIAPHLVLAVTESALRSTPETHRADLLAGQLDARRRLARIDIEDGAEPATGQPPAPRRRGAGLARRWGANTYLRVDAPIAVHHAVAALAPSPHPDTDRRLRQILIDAIARVRRDADQARPATPGGDIDWSVALRLTGG